MNTAIVTTNYLQTDLLSYPRAIHNPEEMYLLFRIFEKQDRHAEAVKILDSENVGLKSRILQNDWIFILCKISCLKSGGLWEDGVSFVKSLLTVPDDEKGQKAIQQYDDWEVWYLLMKAGRFNKTPECVIESHILWTALIDS